MHLNKSWIPHFSIILKNSASLKYFILSGDIHLGGTFTEYLCVTCCYCLIKKIWFDYFKRFTWCLVQRSVVINSSQFQLRVIYLLINLNCKGRDFVSVGKLPTRTRLAQWPCRYHLISTWQHGAPPSPPP